MRAVLDTNVLVAGLLNASGPPGWIVEAVLAGEVEPVFDSSIRSEYEEVLARRELSLSPARVTLLLETLDRFGLQVTVPPWSATLPDPDDAPFLAVAAWLDCPLVTGNLKHFPARSRRGVTVCSPREFLAMLSPDQDRTGR